MTIPVSILICCLWLCCAPAWAQDPFVGNYSAEIGEQRYRIEIERLGADSYDGLLWIDAEKLQFDGRRYGERLVGRVANESRQFGIRAQLQGSALILETETGERLVLWRNN